MKVANLGNLNPIYDLRFTTEIPEHGGDSSFLSATMAFSPTVIFFLSTLGNTFIQDSENTSNPSSYCVPPLLVPRRLESREAAARYHKDLFMTGLMAAHLFSSY